MSKVMNTIKKTILIPLLLIFFLIAPQVQAATSPDLQMAESFVILSSSYTNTAPGTTLNGDLGYTTPPAVAPTVNGNIHVADITYNQAGIDQGTALANLNSQPCDFNFAPGAIDLASDVTHGPVGVYTPGVYCITGTASIGGGGTITLTGAGTYIFRMDGALTTSANSVVTLAGGASACDVWWTPTSVTTLGADSTFVGTDIDAAGITIGSNVTWTGRALAFGGTVSTDVDTISAPTCAAIPPVTPPVTPPGGTTGTGASLASTGQSTLVMVVLISALLAVGLGSLSLQRKLN